MSAQVAVKTRARRKIGDRKETNVWNVQWLPDVANGDPTSYKPDYTKIVKDKWFWLLEENGQSSVRSCYRRNKWVWEKVNGSAFGVKASAMNLLHEWREAQVKMHLHLLSQDEAYVDCIERGPHVPMRAATGNEPSVPKPRHEWSDLDIEQVRKDKKAMNILFNGVDGDMFDNIINCKTAKDVWDTIQIICDGTEQTKDSNLKFLRSLSKEWKPMTVSLRNSQDYKEFTLERLYCILKTYELEIEQDERMERGKKKIGSIALVSELEKEKETKMEQLNQLQGRFAKLKFKKNFGAAKPNRSMVDKSKFKYFKCGLAGHFVTDGLDEDEDVSYVNLALMAKSDETETSSSSNQVITINLAHLSKVECNDAINDMSTELYHLRVTLKSLTKENAKIRENNLFLSERNNVLESQFIDFEKLRIECKIAKEELTESLKKEEILKKQLDREQEVIKAWKISRDVHAQITKVQGIESFCDAAWKKNTKKLD
ncbi:hypothetical protein AgCh_032618 [Apium graveolens]